MGEKKKSSKKFPRKSTKKANPLADRADKKERDPKLEKKVLFGTICATLLGFIFQIIAMSTEYWLILEIPDGIYNSKTGSTLLKLRTGLWRLCVTSSVNGTEAEVCQKHDMFPTTAQIRANKRVDRDLLDFLRTMTAFAIIAIIIIVLGHCFAIYTYKRPRYILKRLTGLIYLMTAGALLVLNEVFSRAVNYSKENLPHLYPAKADDTYGGSFVLSWIDFVIFLIAGIIFLGASAKRKAEMADHNDEMIEADEPMQLGRV